MVTLLRELRGSCLSCSVSKEKAEATIERIQDKYEGDITVKTYDYDDKVRLKSYKEYTLKPKSSTEVKAGPGPRIQVKCAGYVWTIDVGDRQGLPTICYPYSAP